MRIIWQNINTYISELRTLWTPFLVSFNDSSQQSGFLSRQRVKLGKIDESHSTNPQPPAGWDEPRPICHEHLFSWKGNTSRTCSQVRTSSQLAHHHCPEDMRVTVTAQNKTRSHSNLTLFMMTSSPLQGLCVQQYQLRWGSLWYLICTKGWLCSHSLLQLHLIYEDFALILFCSCVPLIPSPHCSKLPVPPAHGALTFHPFPLRAWSGNSHYIPQIHIIHPLSWKVLFPQHAVLWHTHPSPSWLMSKLGFNGPGRIIAQAELKCSYITVSSTSQADKKLRKNNKSKLMFHAQKHSKT